MSETIKETFTARFCRTPEEYALSALEFVCSEADRLEAENDAMENRILELQIERDKFKAFVQRARNISHERSAIIALHDEARELLSRENEVRNER